MGGSLDGTLDEVLSLTIALDSFAGAAETLLIIIVVVFLLGGGGWYWGRADLGATASAGDRDQS